MRLLCDLNAHGDQVLPQVEEADAVGRETQMPRPVNRLGHETIRFSVDLFYELSSNRNVTAMFTL